MKKTDLTVTSLSIERKLLNRLKTISLKSSADGGPHVSVSKLICDAVKQSLKKPGAK